MGKRRGEGFVMRKILFIGEIGPGQTSCMRMRALKRLGYKVRGVHTMQPWTEVPWLHRQVQRRCGQGAVIDKINEIVLAAAKDFLPDVVWAEKQEYIRADTLEAIRSLGARLVHFTPDPYFFIDWKKTKLMDQAIKRFDVLVYCKSYEKKNYEALGKQLVYMPLGYCDEVHRPLKSNHDKWSCMFGFLGGWDPRREVMLRSLAGANKDLKISGVAWDFLRDGRWTLRRHLILRQLAGKASFRIHADPVLSRCLQGGEVYGDDYARALSGAKIGLGFLRVVWPDQHTTRTFEIPACGSMLLADRSDEHREFFTEGFEADFFSSEVEFIDKAIFYAENETARSRIASAGHERSKRSGYAYVHRMAHAMAQIE